MRKSLCHLGVVALVSGFAGPMAHAAEHVTLSNGFTVDCSRHETVDGKVRLYTSGENYMEVESQRITQIETQADRVAPIPGTFSTDAVKPIPITFDKFSLNEISGPQNKDKLLSQEELHPLLLSAGAEHRIDEDLLASVVKAESAGHARAVSRVGAQGLMQLMPQTAADLGVHDAFQPKQNIDGGAAYLDQLLTKYHDNVMLALAAYNAGPRAVDRYHGVPPYAETRAYVRRVILEFNRRKRVAAEQTQVAAK